MTRALPVYVDNIHPIITRTITTPHRTRPPRRPTPLFVMMSHHHSTSTHICHLSHKYTTHLHITITINIVNINIMAARPLATRDFSP